MIRITSKTLKLILITFWTKRSEIKFGIFAMSSETSLLPVLGGIMAVQVMWTQGLTSRLPLLKIQKSIPQIIPLKCKLN